MKTKILLLAGVLLVITVPGAHTTPLRDNLKGLQGICVFIKIYQPDFEKHGLVNPDLLQTRLERSCAKQG